MASIKVKFRPSTIAGQEGSIYYQVLHDRVPRQMATVYKVLSEEWDGRRGNVIIPKNTTRKEHLVTIRERIKLDVERFTKIIRRMEDNGVSFTSEDICEEFRSFSDRLSLINYMEKAILRLKERGKKSTSCNYRNALSSFKHFLATKGEDDVLLDNVTPELMEDYQAYLQDKGIVRNTISFYTRILRATYNRAVEEDVVEDRNPFKHVYTGVDKTVKRALPLPIIKKLKGLELSLKPALDYARDMFMLSFYMRGMSFIDMCYLKKSDLQNGIVTYRRRKTGQQLTIEWTKEMQMIIDKYPDNTSDYLFPIITSKDANERSVYRNTGYNINRNLKKVAKLMGLNFKLTMYCARHSWASAAKAKGIPLSVISEGMGHDSEATTQIYLASLDTSVVDKANSIIIKALK